MLGPAVLSCVCLGRMPVSGNLGYKGSTEAGDSISPTRLLNTTSCRSVPEGARVVKCSETIQWFLSQCQGANVLKEQNLEKDLSDSVLETQ